MRKQRTAKPYPDAPFEEVLVLAAGIQQCASGQKVRRLTLFDHIKQEADSNASRRLVTNSGKYGLTAGSYAAEYLELTPNGTVVTSPDSKEDDRLRAKFELAIAGVAPFKALFEKFAGNKLPATAVLADTLRDAKFDGDAEQYAELFIVNLRYLGLLRTIAGAERILTLEHALDEAGKSQAIIPARPSPQIAVGIPVAAPPPKTVVADLSTVCFYITPIGEEASEERKHSDLFLSSLVEPAMEQFGLKVVRADQIGKPGMITAQILDHVLRCRLVVADLSFHNPNVFYELSLRHAAKLPCVQIIRKADRIPFDLNQYRTIKIDNSSIYTLVPSLGSYQAEIAAQVREALANPEASDNPISTFFPTLKLTFDGRSE